MLKLSIQMLQWLAECSLINEKIRLEPDEMVYKFQSTGMCCLDFTMREPYAQMGGVETEEEWLICCTCFSAETDSVDIYVYSDCRLEEFRIYFSCF